jgi:hypothetical protein
MMATKDIDKNKLTFKELKQMALRIESAHGWNNKTPAATKNDSNSQTNDETKSKELHCTYLRCKNPIGHTFHKCPTRAKHKCDYCGAKYHLAMECRKMNNNDNTSTNNTINLSHITCHQCGEKGHYANTCTKSNRIKRDDKAIRATRIEDAKHEEETQQAIRTFYTRNDYDINQVRRAIQAGHTDDDDDEPPEAITLDTGQHRGEY